MSLVVLIQPKDFEQLRRTIGSIRTSCRVTGKGLGCAPTRRERDAGVPMEVTVNFSGPPKGVRAAYDKLWSYVAVAPEPVAVRRELLTPFPQDYLFGGGGR